MLGLEQNITFWQISVVAQTVAVHERLHEGQAVVRVALHAPTASIFWDRMGNPWPAHVHTDSLPSLLLGVSFR